MKISAKGKWHGRKLMKRQLVMKIISTNQHHQAGGGSINGELSWTSAAVSPWRRRQKNSKRRKRKAKADAAKAIYNGGAVIEAASICNHQRLTWRESNQRLAKWRRQNGEGVAAISAKRETQ